MKSTILIALAPLALLTGCVSPQARRGRVIQADVGNRFPNFTFQDERGTAQDLSQNLGDFTVLVFSECGEDLHGPVSAALVDLVQPNQEPGYSETVGFDIHWSRDGCRYHSDCHLLEGGPHIFSICDGRSQVRDLYDADAAGEIIVIGPDRRIVDRAPMRELDSISSRLARRFSDHAEVVIQTRSPDE
ncbi:MAG: hypothetical protein J5J06_16160 [Phycisphaerae bacterium]|nr:hypothetical protein [Phycisphaerae bacterium]